MPLEQLSSQGIKAFKEHSLKPCSTCVGRGGTPPHAEQFYRWKNHHKPQHPYQGHASLSGEVKREATRFDT